MNTDKKKIGRARHSVRAAGTEKKASVEMMRRARSDASYLSSGVEPSSSVVSKEIVPELLSWFEQNARDLPWRRTRDPYAIWVSEIMLQQTQVKTVIPYWERWMRELPTIEALATADPEKIHKLWEGLGYYTRVRNMQKAAQEIVAGNIGGSRSSPFRRGEFPKTFDAVFSLPGIGRYTAGAICSIAFNQPTPILDGNVIRVLTRVFGIQESPREKKTNARLWELAEELVSHAKAAKVAKIKHPSRSLHPLDKDNACSYFNQSLMELGALVCTPRQPKCELCPLANECVARQTNRVEQLPNIGERTVATARRFAAFIFEDAGHFLVRQRPAGVVNAHLWEFPNVELNGESNVRKVAKTEFGFAPSELNRLCTIKHSITRYRITLEAYAAVGGSTRKTLANAAGKWLAMADLKKLSFPSAHKRILTALESSAR